MTADRTSFRAKGCRGHFKIAALPQCLTIELHCLRKTCISWRLVGTAPCLKREVEKKEREEGKRASGQAGKRAREQESKRARRQEGTRAKGQEGKKARCEDEKM